MILKRRPPVDYSCLLFCGTLRKAPAYWLQLRRTQDGGPHAGFNCVTRFRGWPPVGCGCAACLRRVGTYWFRLSRAFKNAPTYWLQYIALPLPASACVCHNSSITRKKKTVSFFCAEAAGVDSADVICATIRWFVSKKVF